jgi:hypothetical protein
VYRGVDRAAKVLCRADSDRRERYDAVAVPRRVVLLDIASGDATTGTRARHGTDVDIELT